MNTLNTKKDGDTAVVLLLNAVHYASLQRYVIPSGSPPPPNLLPHVSYTTEWISNCFSLWRSDCQWTSRMVRFCQ
jgi:hypothetical protein